MTHHQVATAAAPAAIGPYSQAIQTGTMTFCSGQIGLDPATGTLVAGGIEPETRQVLENLRAVLRAAGLSPADVVKTTVFLTDMAGFPTMNEVYAGFFPVPCPARSTVQVAALPKGACVEIEAIVVRRSG